MKRAAFPWCDADRHQAPVAAPVVASPVARTALLAGICAFSTPFSKYEGTPKLDLFDIFQVSKALGTTLTEAAKALDGEELNTLAEIMRDKDVASS
jgi:hypothetical protein